MTFNIFNLVLRGFFCYQIKLRSLFCNLIKREQQQRLCTDVGRRLSEINYRSRLIEIILCCGSSSKNAFIHSRQMFLRSTATVTFFVDGSELLSAVIEFNNPIKLYLAQIKRKQGKKFLKSYRGCNQAKLL